MALKNYVYGALMTMLVVHGASDALDATRELPSYIKQEKIMLAGAPRHYVAFALEADLMLETSILSTRDRRPMVHVGIAAIVEGSDLNFMQRVVSACESIIKKRANKPVADTKRFSAEIFDRARRIAVNGDFAKAGVASDMRMQAVWFTVVPQRCPSDVVFRSPEIVHEFTGVYASHAKIPMRKIILPITAEEQLKNAEFAFIKKSTPIAEKMRFYTEYVKTTDSKHEAIVLRFDADAYLKSLSN